MYPIQCRKPPSLPALSHAAELPAGARYEEILAPSLEEKRSAAVSTEMEARPSIVAAAEGKGPLFTVTASSSHVACKFCCVTLHIVL